MDLRSFAFNIRERSEQFAEIVSACRTLLKTAPEAYFFKKYISERVSNQSIEKFDIGYFPPDDKLDLIFDLVGQNTLRNAGLIYDIDVNNRSHIDTKTKGILNYHNLIFPLCDEYGNIVALSGRTLLDEDQRNELKINKYKNIMYKKQMYLFGLHEAKKTIECNDNAILVEGQIDCISCHEHGFTNTVAITGSKVTLIQIFLLKRKTNNIYLLFDNDGPGRTAADRTIKKYSEYININVLNLPSGYHDVHQYLSKNKGDSDNIFSLNCRG